MTYPDVRYTKSRWRNYLELHSFDGTYRGVLFRDAVSAIHALVPGRAELDCAAVDLGMLPEGAYLVSRASVSNDVRAARTNESGEADTSTPFDEVRLRFSLSLAVHRSEYITRQRDFSFRERHPELATRYDRAIAIIGGAA